MEAPSMSGSSGALVLRTAVYYDSINDRVTAKNQITAIFFGLLL